MSRVSVNSSNITGLEYNKENSSLLVYFKGGSVYRYNEVPFEEYENLLHAKSVGSYLHRSIKGSYDFERVS